MKATAPRAADFWNVRYAGKACAHSTEPNACFRQRLDALPPGRLLRRAEGGGRNAVYAARCGWLATTVDFSPGHYDARGRIRAHLAPAHRRAVHAAAAASLAPGGHVFPEAFGPRVAALLYEPAALAEDFAGFALLENQTLGVVLREGRFHAGPASAVRLLATRPASCERLTNPNYPI